MEAAATQVQEPDGGSSCIKQLSVAVVDLENQGSDGAQSGKSETIAEALALADDPAAAAAAAAAASVEQEPPSTVDQPQPAPLPPPDASEGPAAAEEYERYLQRWEEGQTLAQRWHRLAQKGRLGDIQAEWEDWRLDVMLGQVRQRTAAALSQQGKAVGGFGGSLICSTRLRRGRGEVQEADDSPPEEPTRRVRSRRAPSTLQDFHADAAAANKTPERTPDAAADPAAAAAGGSGYTPSRYRQQQLLPAQAADAASEDSTDDAADNVTARTLQQGPAQPQQQQQQRPPGRRGPLPQQPSKRVVTRVQRSSAAQQQQAPNARLFNRVITPFNPQLLQQQQQMQAQTQHMMHAMQQQEQQQVAAAAAMAGVSPEMLDEFYAMGSRLGAAFGQGEGGPAGGLAQNPAAMAAFMHALYQYGANPSALAQQVASVMGGPQ